MENTNVAVQEWKEEKQEDGYIVQLTNTKQVSYCSMKPKTDEEKVQLYNAVNNAEQRISECANMELSIKHVFAEVVECISTETGLPEKCPRVVLIDANGVGYTAVSKGVFSALTKMFPIFGTPDTWKKPLTIVPKVITKGDKKITTLQIKGFK